MNDQRLATTLSREDFAEDSGSLDPMDRVTCRPHGRWLHSCVGSASHANPCGRAAGIVRGSSFLAASARLNLLSPNTNRTSSYRVASHAGSP
jgi:hypothetical protein